MGDTSHMELWCVVGFLYILNDMFLSSLEMVKSKKLVLFYCHSLLP